MNTLEKRKLNGLLLGTSCLFASAFMVTLPALANPTGGTVVSGHDTISSKGKTTTVDQTSQKGFIDWNSFSVAPGETVKFVQPGKNSVTVNRVTGNDPSKILGELLANGGVWILNGNGVLFGKGSVINVGSLIATTSDISDDDFKNGKYRFKKPGNPNASVINQGTITASDGGSVVLSAAHVANEGVIQANLGKVVLGGAAAFTVDLNGDNLIRYQVTKPVSQTPTNSQGDPRGALVSNSGKIEADGGTVLMTSRAASGVQDNVINNSGVVEATSVSSHDGEVDLDAGDGTVKDSGTVNVSGTQAGQTGGDVTITGRKIVLADSARVDAQGYDGGGTVLIGGNFHGQGSLRQAHDVVIGKAVIDVDATHKGDGGKVAIWSKGDTRFDGTITATGGRQGGSGGYVETSGHELSMDSSALVNTSALKGNGGTWLLDPTDVTIENCGGNCNAVDISNTAIANSLGAGTNVTIEAVGTGAGTGNITVVDPITANGAGILSLLATFDIDIEASIQNAGSGAINLVAGWDGSTGVSGTPTTGESGSAVNINTITSTPGAYGNNGASIIIGNGYSSTAVSVGSAGGTTTVAAGGLTVGANGNFTANAQLGYAGTSGGGDINVVLSGDLTVQSDNGGNSRIGNTGTTGAVTGNITISADNVTMSAYSGNDGQAVIGNSGTAAVSGNITITTTGDLTVEAGKYGSQDTTVLIGNYTSANAGTTGNIKVSVGGDLSMQAKYGGTAQIGSKSSTASVNVTAAGNISLNASYYSSQAYTNMVGIGNFGSSTANAGGNITVSSTNGNITLALNTLGLVEIGNSGGVVVSGDVHVVAANGTVTVGNYYTSGTAQIGNNGAYGSYNTTVKGNVSINAGAVSVISTGSTTAYAQIGNSGGANTQNVGGNILVSSYGALTLDGAEGQSVWIGNIGGNTGATEVGDVTLVADSLSVTDGGDADATTLGNMVASDLTGSLTTATSGAGGSGGGNVTIAITGTGTTDWGTYFGDGINFANGNALSLITTGAQTISTSIQATENGNVNLIAGWDGTTGFGPTSINIGDILASPSAYGSTGGDIVVGGGNAPGGVSIGSLEGNTTVAAANVTLDAVNGFAQIGFNGAGGSGNIDVLANANIAVSAGANFAQIGNGGQGVNGNSAGNITVTAVGAVDVTGGTGGYAQIGNGGAGSNDGGGAGSDSGNISVQGASVSLEAGSGNGSYAQIGHGGSGSDQASGSGTTGNISVVATDGDILLQGGSSGNTGQEDNDYAQIGMGGPFSGTDTSNKDRGSITVNASGNISILGGTDADQQNGFAIIGDTGTAEKTGNITVSAGGNITITGGSATGDPDFGGLSNSFAMIGDDNAGSITGNVKVTAGGDLALTGGGTGTGTGDTAQVGDDSSNSDVTGNLSVSVGGILSFTSTGDAALIADIASGTASGTTLIKTADIDLTSDFYGDLGLSLGDDLDNGNTTLEITDSSADTVIAGAINASSANTLKILDTGSLHIQSSIQNSGSGAIYVVAGWDGSTTSASALTNAGVYGNNGGDITVGDVLGDVAVGSQSGNTTFAAANVTVDAVGGYAQIGYHGAGGGNIIVDARNAVTVESGSYNGVSYDAVIGNGNFDNNTADSAGNATGNITVKSGTGGITVSATGGNDIAAIGNVTDDGASGESGNITLNTTGAVMLETPDADSFAYIGDFSLASTTGGASGNIVIDAGSLDITNAADSSESIIGNGGAIGVGTATQFTNQGTVSGNITITTGNVNMTATGAGQYGGQSRIGDRGAGTVNGNISVNASGNMTLSTDQGDVASIGNSADGANGISSGNITVVVGGNLSLLAQDTGESRIAAGQTADTNVNVTVTGDILMQVMGTPTTYGGEAVIGNFANGVSAASGNITVTSKTGNITLDAAEDDSFALIGNAIGTTVGGAVRVNAVNGTIAVDAGGDGSLAQIGEFGEDGASGGDIIIKAGDLELDASGTGAVSQIGNGGEDMDGDASGDISIAVSGNLTLEGGNGVAMIGNGDPFVLTNNSTGNGDASGNISVAVGGTTTIADTGTAPSVWIGNLADTGAESGSVIFKTKDIDDSGDAPGDFDAFVAADLDGGNVTLEFTDTTATATFGGLGDYDSANSLKILSEGNIDLTGSLQNAGDGSIYVIGGWDGTTTQASQLTNTGVYGNNNGSVTIGGGADAASVGSESGTTIVAGDNITVNGQSNLAQIGWDGAGGGDISVLATGNVIVRAMDAALIGNGGAEVTGNVGGNITVTATGNIQLTAAASGADVQIGNGGFDSNGQDSGAVTVDAGGAIVAKTTAASGTSYIQIGNGGSGAQGSATGAVNVTAADISLTTDNPGYIQIGNGGSEYDGNTSGDITVSASGNILGDADIDNSYIQIGNGGFTSTGNDSGNIALTAGNDLDLETTNSSGATATLGSYVQVGNGGDMSNEDSANGFSETGNITVRANTIELTSDADLSGVLIGNGGTCAGAAGASNAGCTGLMDTNTQGSIVFGGDISVKATTSLTMLAEAVNDVVGIGNGSNDSASGANASGSISDSGNITVIVGTSHVAGTLALTAGDRSDFVHIGNGGFETNLDASADDGVAESGDIDVKVNGGTDHGAVATLISGGASSDNVVLVGNDGTSITDGSVTGDVAFTVDGALSLSAQAGYAIIGDTIGIAGASTGNVTITAQSLSGISQSIANDLPHGNLTLNLLGDNTFAITSDADYSSDHTLSITNAGNIVFDASVQNGGDGAINVTSTDGNILVGGGGAIGNVAVGSAGGTSTFTADNVTVNAANGYAQIGYHGETGGNISIDTTGTVSLVGGNNSSKIAQIGNGSAFDSSAAGGNITIAAASVSSSGPSDIAGQTANIALSSGGIGSAFNPLEFAVSDLAVQTNGGSVFATSDTQGISLGVGAEGIDLNGGEFSLVADGAVTQTRTIHAGSIVISANQITLTDAGNKFGDATIDATNNASIFDASSLVVDNADVGGTLALSSGGDISQSGAISAGALDVIANNGSIALTNSQNNFQTVTVDSSGDTSVFDVANMTIASAKVGGSLTLAGAQNISQTGGIRSGALNVTTSSGSVALTNANNRFGNTTVDASGDASLYDSSDFVIASADVGGTLSLSGGNNISQTGPIDAAVLDVTANHGNIVLTNADNAFDTASVDSSGNASLSDASDLTIASANVGGALKLKSDGSIDQSGAIVANSLTVVADTIALTNTGNSFADAALNASGDASLYDSSNLTITGADVGGALSLSGGGDIGQSGAITAGTLDVSASNGSITLTNAGNAFGSTTVSASDNASLFDASDLVIAGADVGNALSLSSGGDISQTGAITARSLNANANHGSITLTNTGNTFNNARLNSSGDASLYDASDLMIAGADVGGTLSLASGGNIGQSGAITADTLDVTANNGKVALTNAKNAINTASLTSSGSTALSDSSNLTVASANVGGSLTLKDSGSIDQTGSISAKSLTITAGSFALTNTGNDFGSATIDATGNAALYDASNLVIAGADVGGMLSLSSGGDVSQTGAISAASLNLTADNITLTNTGNSFAGATIDATGDAALYDASDVVIAGADVGGTLSLTGGGDIGQSGAITAATLDVTAGHGSIALTNAENSIDTASLTSSGNAALSDSTGLTIADANVGGTLSLSSGGALSQTGAINAAALDVSAGSVTLTNTGNTFDSATVDATGDGSLYDASDMNIAGADVGGTLSLAGGGNIGQSGAITANTLNVTADNGAIALTNADNAVAAASLSSSGDASLYDSESLTVNGASTGGNLTLLSEGNLAFISSVQLNSGNLIAVAGWDGTMTNLADLTQAGAYGNNGGSITVGGTGATGNVTVGSDGRLTELAGANVSVEADNGYAQVGFHGKGRGDIKVLATQNVTLSGGGNAGDYAQIGHGGMGVSGNESGNITVRAGNAVSVDGGTGQDSYAQIGHGGADADKNSSGYTNSGNITVEGETVALVAGAGSQGYAQIGNGGYDLGEGLTGKGVNEGAITVDAVDGVSLSGNGADAYAQIGNGGDQVNSHAGNNASGSNSGDIDVDAGNGSVTMIAGTGADAYVQIGNGGFDINAGGNAANFQSSGNITVSDLTLTGSNSGVDGYAQVGNGDASKTGIGNASGNITIDAGTIRLTNGRANDAPALIGNQTGDGTVTGTITGYTPPPPPADDTNPPPSTQGAITSTIQSQTVDIGLIIEPPPPDTSSDTTTPDTSSTGPLEQLAGGDEDTDTASDELGQSLSGHKNTTQTVSIIPGVLTEVVDTQTPHGIPPANQDYSSWGNEALWRW